MATDKRENMMKIIPVIFFSLLFLLSACSPAALPSELSSSLPAVIIPTVKSPVDFNGNGMDDYADFLTGARLDVANSPRYDGSFYTAGGYPPDDIGVCTDVIWRAFKHAGYSLKDMVDRDIKQNPDAYPRVGGNPDPNIDFRRVKNLTPYFERHALSLTLDMTEIEQWNAGDIVIYKNPDHIAIVSDKRNADGVPYIVHTAGHPEEADRLNFSEIIGHYRFDASRLNQEDLIRFEASE